MPPSGTPPAPTPGWPPTGEERRCGQPASPAKAALDRAEAIADSLEQGPPSVVVSRPRAEMVNHWRGHVLTRLRHTTSAYTVNLHELATLLLARRCARGKVHANLADVCLQGNDLDAAVWHLEQAYCIAKGTASPRELLRVRQLRGRLWWAKRHPAVRQLDDLMREQ